MSNANKLVFRALRTTVKLISKLHPALPKTIEIEMKRIQGKGGGATLETEVTSSLNFLFNMGVADPIVLDVGANIGLYSEEILRACPSAKIYAFEPSSTARALLTQRLGAHPQVSIIPLALGSENKEKTLYADYPGSGLASLSKRRLEHFGIELQHHEEVQVTTLSDWMQSNQVTPDLLKLDIEGFELFALQGGFKELKQIKLIQFEFGGTNIDSRTFFQDFWYLLTGQGFNLYIISPSGPVKVNNYSEEDEYFVTTNFLAVKS